MEIFEKLPDEINHLVSEFSSTPVVGDLSCGITQYSFWLIVSTIVLLIVLAVFKKKQALVPKGFFVNGFEYIIEYVENDIGKGVVGENWKKHFPFLCSLFLFILIYAIELVVGAIQAYVFTVLTAVYVSEAEEVAEEE